MSVRIMQGDCRSVLKTLPDESVHCVVTSPPYFGLRDYGMADQIGLEQTPQAFVDELVAVFREVRRVLRSDGTLWLNLGDSYATGAGGVGDCPGGGKQGESWKQRGKMTPPNRMPLPGLKPKDLIGIPWRVAFALQADGWWLRQDIIWSKPNPMPESVRDRCTKAHEYLFLLAKSERYHFDAAAMQEPVESDKGNANSFRGGAYCNNATFDNDGDGGRRTVTGNTKRSGNKERKPASARGVPVDTDGKSRGAVAGSIPWEGATRNKRSVWTVGTERFAEAHFATFPPALIEPCIKAGCPEGGAVLDPFGGAGTTGMVADRLQRNALLIELNPAYIEIAERRIRGDAPLFAALECKERQVCRRAIGDLKISEFSALDYIRTDEELRLYVAECIRLHDAKSAAALEQAEQAVQEGFARIDAAIADFSNPDTSGCDPELLEAAARAIADPSVNAAAQEIREEPER